MPPQPIHWLPKKPAERIDRIELRQRNTLTICITTMAHKVAP
jgi:hypothetical protein